MSQKEIERLSIIQQLQSKQLSQVEAAEQIGVSTRQIRRLQCRYKKEKARGLISKHRGKPSNNRIRDDVKEEVIDILKTHYHDFGPTLAQEKLNEIHGIKISVEKVRQIMIHLNLWFGKKRKKLYVHQQRARRSCLGELVQIDGSPHAWFEERAPECCLLVFIDDATSRLMMLHFAEKETTEAYFRASQAYIKQHGRPVAYYSDRHSIFRVNITEAAIGSGETQFGRAMRELGIYP